MSEARAEAEDRYIEDYADPNGSDVSTMRQRDAFVEGAEWQAARSSTVGREAFRHAMLESHRLNGRARTVEQGIEMAWQVVTLLDPAEPTDEEVEAAAKAFHDAEIHPGAWDDWDCWQHNTEAVHEMYRARVRVALQAARGVRRG